MGSHGVVSGCCPGAEFVSEGCGAEMAQNGLTPHTATWGRGPIAPQPEGAAMGKVLTANPHSLFDSVPAMQRLGSISMALEEGQSLHQ